MHRECGSLKKQRFLKPTPSWGFQPWRPQKRIGLGNWWEIESFSHENPLYPLARTNARSVRQWGPNSNERPPFWTKCTGNVVVWRNKDFSNLLYPFLKVSALKKPKKGRFEKLVGEDFSNPPLFESFSPENPKKGWVWETGGRRFLKTTPCPCWEICRLKTTG